MEQIYGADRASLLAEVHDLRYSNNTSRIELQEVRQKSTRQLSALEEQSTNREKQLKRQGEFKLKRLCWISVHVHVPHTSSMERLHRGVN